MIIDVVNVEIVKCRHIGEWMTRLAPKRGGTEPGRRDSSYARDWKQYAVTDKVSV